MTCALCSKRIKVTKDRSYDLSFHTTNGLVLGGDICYPCADKIMATGANYIVDTYGAYLKVSESELPLEVATTLKENLGK